MVYQEFNFPQLSASDFFRVKSFFFFVQCISGFNFYPADFPGALLALMDVVSHLERELFGEKQVFAKHMQPPPIPDEIVDKKWKDNDSPVELLNQK